MTNSKKLPEEVAAAVLKNEDTLSIRLLFEDEAVIMVPVFAKKKGGQRPPFFNINQQLVLEYFPPVLKGNQP